MLSRNEIEETFAELGLATEEDRDRFRHMRELHHRPTGMTDSGGLGSKKSAPLTIEGDDAELGRDSE